MKRSQFCWVWAPKQLGQGRSWFRFCREIKVKNNFAFGDTGEDWFYPPKQYRQVVTRIQNFKKNSCLLLMLSVSAGDLFFIWFTKPPWPPPSLYFSPFKCSRVASRNDVIRVPAASQFEALGHWTSCRLWRVASENGLIKTGDKLWNIFLLRARTWIFKKASTGEITSPWNKTNCKKKN